MQLLINNMPADIKAGTTIDYTIENPLFTQSEGFTLSITLPLKDSPNNYRIFGFLDRTDVLYDYRRVDLPARLLLTADIYKDGILKILEVSDTEISAQFLDGIAATNSSGELEHIYINELNIMVPDIEDYLPIPESEDDWRIHDDLHPADDMYGIDHGYPWYIFKWNNNYSGILHGSLFFVDAITKAEKFWTHHSCNEYMVNLRWLTEQIISAAGYDYDLREWANNQYFRYLIACNSLPETWPEAISRNYCRALPHWTLKYYLDQLGTLLGGLFSFEKNTITFHFYTAYQSGVQPIDIVNSYKTEFPDNTAYVLNSIIKYDHTDIYVEKYNTFNPQTLMRQGSIVVDFLTIDDMLQYHKANWAEFETPATPPIYRVDNDKYFLPYISDVREKTDANQQPVIANGQKVYICKSYIMPFGAYATPETGLEEQELKIIPAPIVDGNCVIFDCGELDNTTSKTTPENPKTNEQALIESGMADNQQEFFDHLYVAFFKGLDPDDEQTKDLIPAPVAMDNQFTYRVVPHSPDGEHWTYDWICQEIVDREMGRIFRPTEHRQYLTQQLHKIKPEQTLTARFLSATMPNIGSIFVINYQQYLCIRLTTKLTAEKDDGELMFEGVFVPIRN